MTIAKALRAAFAGSLVLAACSNSSTPAQSPPGFVPPAGPIGVTTVSPTRVDLRSLAATSSVTVSETGYAGAFSAANDCASTSVTPASGTPAFTGGPVDFTVRAGILSESCTLTITDTKGSSTRVPIVVTVGTVGSLTVAPATLAVTTATNATFTASEAGYGGTLDQFFSARATCTPAGAVDVASSAFPTSAGATATFSAIAHAAGSCTVTVSDALGRRATLPITATRAIAFTAPAFNFVDLTPQTVGVRENDTFAFNVVSSTCGALALVKPVAGDPTAFTIAATSAGLATGADCTATFGDGSGGTGSVRVYVDLLSIGVQ